MDDVKVKISCNTEIKVQTVLFPFSPTAKLSISVVGVNEIEAFPELFRLAFHCFISSENRHFGCGDGRGNRYRCGKRKSEFTLRIYSEFFCRTVRNLFSRKAKK